MLLARVLLASFNTTSHYYTRGVYEEGLYLKSAEYFRALIETPGGKKWYAEHNHLLHAESQRQLEKRAVQG